MSHSYQSRLRIVDTAWCSTLYHIKCHILEAKATKMVGYLCYAPHGPPFLYPSSHFTSTWNDYSPQEVLKDLEPKKHLAQVNSPYYMAIPAQRSWFGKQENQLKLKVSNSWVYPLRGLFYSPHSGYFPCSLFVPTEDLRLNPGPTHKCHLLFALSQIHHHPGRSLLNINHVCSWHLGCCPTQE